MATRKKQPAKKAVVRGPKAHRVSLTEEQVKSIRDSSYQDGVDSVDIPKTSLQDVHKYFDSLSVTEQQAFVFDFIRALNHNQRQATVVLEKTYFG